MDRDLLQKICNQIYKRFPEVNGSKPKVRAYEQDQSLLIFQGNGTTADGHSIPRIIRVIVSPDGKIKKITTSR